MKIRRIGVSLFSSMLCYFGILPVATCGAKGIMDEHIRLALDYPYERPSKSYLFDDGKVLELDIEDETLFANRFPVIAYGSNASAAQLYRKFSRKNRFGNPTSNRQIPVERAILKDFEILYAPVITTYGSVPATISYSEGAETEIFITWLTREQLLRMHQSEGNYQFEELLGADIMTSRGRLQKIYAYRHGSNLTFNSSRYSLSAIPGSSKNHPEFSQLEMLQKIKQTICIYSELPCSMNIFTFIEDYLLVKPKRFHINAILKRLHSSHESWEEISSTDIPSEIEHHWYLFKQIGYK